MNNSKKYVVGAISSHGHERGHVLVLHQLPDVEAIHVCATTEFANVDDMAAESSKVVSKAKDVEELLVRQDLDAVTVCARPDHAPAIMEQVVKAGLPVLYDKPAAIHSSHLRRVADIAKQKDVTVGAMLQWRYNPMIQDLKNALSQGALGEVMAIEGKLLNGLVQYRDTSTYLFNPDTAGSGILSWLGCHCLDLILYLMNERVVEVMAMVGNLNPEKLAVEDTGFLILQFQSGRMGTFQAGYHLRGDKETYDFYIGIRGTEGFAELPLTRPYKTPELGAPENAGTYVLFSEADKWVTGRIRRNTFERPETPGYGGIFAEQLFKDFLEKSSTGAPAPAPIDDSIHLLEIVEAAKKSSATRRAVRI